MNPRNAYKNKKMNVERIKQLQDLGFVWDLQEANFDANLSLLKEYKVDERHCNVPRAYKKGKVALGSWVNDLRKAYKKGKMNVEHIKQLDELGFEWAQYGTAWGYYLSLHLDYL